MYIYNNKTKQNKQTTKCGSRTFPPPRERKEQIGKATEVDIEKERERVSRLDS